MGFDDVFEIVRGQISNAGRKRALGTRAYLGTIGHKEVTCHEATLVRRDDPKKTEFPIVVHMQNNLRAYAPADSAILPGDEIRWLTFETKHTAWVLDTQLFASGHKMGGPAPQLKWLPVMPDHKAYMRLLWSDQWPQELGWSLQIGPFINSTVTIEVSPQLHLSDQQNALLHEILRQVQGIRVQIDELPKADLEQIEDLLRDVQEAVAANDRGRLKQAVALLGAVSIGAAGSGTWDGIHALVEALTRLL